MGATDRMKLYLEYKKVSKYSFSKKTGLSNKFLDNSSNMGTDKAEIILRYYPDVNPEWLLTGNGEMLRGESKPITPKKKEKEVEETRPRIPYDAAAGSLSVALDGITNQHMEQIPVIKAFPKYDFTIMAKGDSMLPEFHSGDELACLYVRQSSFIQWGQFHVLDTSQGVVLKRIFDDGEYILCKSENYELFKDFKIHKTEIYNIALVIGLVRRY